MTSLINSCSTFYVIKQQKLSGGRERYQMHKAKYISIIAVTLPLCMSCTPIGASCPPPLLFATITSRINQQQKQLVRNEHRFDQSDKENKGRSRDNYQVNKQLNFTDLFTRLLCIPVIYIIELENTVTYIIISTRQRSNIMEPYVI